MFSEKKINKYFELAKNASKFSDFHKQKIGAITQSLADPDLYQNDRERFFALGDELKELENRKSEAENQWLEISLLAEEIQ